MRGFGPPIPDAAEAAEPDGLVAAMLMVWAGTVGAVDAAACSTPAGSD